MDNNEIVDDLKQNGKGHERERERSGTETGRNGKVTEWLRERYKNEKNFSSLRMSKMFNT